MEPESSWIDFLGGVAVGISLMLLTWLGRIVKERFERKERSLHRIFEAIEKWWDEFYEKSEKEIALTGLANQEEKIGELIRDLGMEDHWFKFSALQRITILGLKPQYAASRDIFEEKTGLPFDGIHLDLLWMKISAAAYKGRSIPTESGRARSLIGHLKVLCDYKRGA